MSSDSERKDLFKRAAEIAAVVPEAMQAEAFNRALEMLAGEALPGDGTGQGASATKPPSRRGKPSRKRVTTTKGPASASTAAPTALSALLDAPGDADEWDGIWEGGTPLDKWLAMLAVAEDEVGQGTYLAPAEIERVLDERFRLTGVHASNIGRDLKGARRLATRRKIEGVYKYALSRRGITHIRSRREELSNE